MGRKYEQMNTLYNKKKKGKSPLNIEYSHSIIWQMMYKGGIIGNLEQRKMYVYG